MVSLSKLFEKHQEKHGREGLERSPQTPCIVKGLGGIKAWFLLKGPDLHDRPSKSKRSCKLVSRVSLSHLGTSTRESWERGSLSRQSIVSIAAVFVSPVKQHSSPTNNKLFGEKQFQN